MKCHVGIGLGKKTPSEEGFPPQNPSLLPRLLRVLNTCWKAFSGIETGNSLCDTLGIPRLLHRRAYVQGEGQDHGEHRAHAGSPCPAHSLPRVRGSNAGGLHIKSYFHAQAAGRPWFCNLVRG